MPVNAEMTFQTYEPLQLNQSKITLQSGERHLGKSLKFRKSFFVSLSIGLDQVPRVEG